MKIRQFIKVMKSNGYNFLKGYGPGYTLIKNNQKYFIKSYDIICIYDINNLNMEDFKF